MTAYWTQAEHATEYDDWVNGLLENAPESFDDDAAAEEIVTRYVRWLEAKPQVKVREHRAYDTQRIHASDTDGSTFICGWCGGWGHKADSEGRPAECHECFGLGWYRDVL